MNTGLAKYGLSVGTLSALNQIRGAQPTAPTAASPVDQDSPEAWADAAAKMGAPGGVITAPQGTNPLERSNPNSAPAVAAGVASDNPAAGEAARQRGILEKATPQGPEEDGFPTVKPMDQGSPAPGQGPGYGTTPARVVPAHWQAGGHNVEVQHGLDPEALRPAMEENEMASQHAYAGADARREANVKLGEADALYAAGHQLASEETKRKLAQIGRDRDNYVAEQQKKFEKLSFESQKKVDPDLHWKERGTGAQIVAALAIAANQFAVMWSGRGQNVALQMIESAIDRNIAAQQANINNARAALDKEENIYARNLAVFGDRERAALATKAQYLDQVAAMANQRRAEARTPEAEAAFEDTLAKIYSNRADIAGKFGQLTASRFAESMNERYMPAQVVGGVTPGVKGKDDHYVPTLGGYARSKEDAAKLNQKGALRMQISENMHQIHGLMEEAKKLNSVSDGVRLKQIDAQISGLVSDALTKNTVLEGQGAMSEGDKAVAAEAKSLKDASVQWTPDFIITKRQQNIKQSATNMLTQHRLEGEAFGVQKGQEQYVMGPNGPVPVQKLEGRNAVVSKRTQGHDDLVQKPKGVDR